MIDLMIRNAKIVDGSGNPWFVGDVAVAGGKIVAVGRLADLKAKEEVDAEGLVLSPGFIDIHSHSDFSILDYPTNESRVLQGITTEIGGNCGLSPAPVLPDKVDYLRKYASFLSNSISYDWQSYGDFLRRIEETGISTNFGGLIGHGTLRVAAMGFDNRKPEPHELETMQTLMRQAMEDGAFGVSSGLIYSPGCYADTDELVEVAKAIAPYGGFYETHMRNEGANILESIRESIEVGRRAGVAVEIAHHKISGRNNWGLAPQSTELIAQARAEGLDITADQYPYIASATTLTSILPSWTFEGGVDKMIERLQDPETRAKIKEQIEASSAKSGRRWSDLLIASVGSEANRRFEGKTVEELAAIVGKGPIDAALDLIIEERAVVGEVSFGMCEEDVATIMRHPLTMVGSDGGAMDIQCGGKPHPRNFGTFARILRKYVREDKVLRLEEAVRKMTSMPATRLRLFDRGLIRSGCWADLVLFDPDTIEDTPSFTNPQQVVKGVNRVWVNGVLVVKDGTHTGSRPGHVLRHR
ncbi:MAG: N-acyl-D-amino-acid deacylase family protein [Bacillota bacterium]